MPLTKSFNELVQNRAASDPEFAAALLREAPGTPPLTMRDALREIWEADRYPILGNEDWRISAALTKEALARAATATASPNDPPEFGRWLAALRDHSSPRADREAVMTALYDLFDPEEIRGKRPIGPICRSSRKYGTTACRRDAAHPVIRIA